MTEKRVVTAILDRLEKDTSNDVQAIAVKTLGLLVRRVPRDLVEDICVRLGKHLLEGRDELRCVRRKGLLYGAAAGCWRPAASCEELHVACRGLEVGACALSGRTCWVWANRAAQRA
jgi:hypothetical protein